ncbi:MAG: S8 family serine peptidase [Dermabacter sp.]|nr:S8 family serine peptidase [Dermabacter sp.]
MSPGLPKRVLALLTSTLLAATLAAPAALASPAEPAPDTQGAEQSSPSVHQRAIIDKLLAESPETPSDERVRVIVMLDNQPTSPSESGERNLLAAQGQLLSTWSTKYDLTVDRQFGYLVNGFSAEMPADEMANLALEPEVASVKRERLYEQTEHAARDLQGVPAALEGYDVDGTGTVISIIDSGVDSKHPDLRLDNCADAKIQSINTAETAGDFTCKVPTGYNYADENFEVQDYTTSQHGQHVAGIAAANGSDGDTPDFGTSGRIDGAAPNAQLLAMKVFSNDPAISRFAQDSDIIAAIEDSVKLDADVINMSLGSPNGLRDSSDGAYRAIDAARDEGVLTVIAAGNDGQNFSLTGGPDDLFGRFDDGTVGQPAVQGASLAVASIDNSGVTVPLGFLGEGANEVRFSYMTAVGTPDGAGHPVTYVGLGRDEDFAADADLTGRYALIQRGEISFADKFQNAIDRGATGVVVFNSAAGGDAYVGMAGVENFQVFGAGLTHGDGLRMVEALEANPDLQIRFTDTLGVQPSPTSLTPSSFTSWGTTNELDFKPEISGIGGNVYSTVGTDGYGTKSGTSMASPNVAGLSALMFEGFKERYPNLSSTERVDLIKTTLMNTAQIPVNEAGVPFAPRQVGAGLARVDLALGTDVTATVDGEASVALREVNAPTSFTVTLTNRGAKDVSYQVPAQTVLKETNDARATTRSVVASDTLTASAETVTVPAGGTATVSFTLAPDTSSTHFVQGWAQLTATTDGASDLAVPYLGFVGDWNAEQIVQDPGELWTEGAINATTGLLGSLGANNLAMTGSYGELALSPNGDGMLDAVVPNLLLMRNADEAQYEILDSSGAVVVEVGRDENLRRASGSAVASATSPGQLTETGRRYGGYVWNAEEGADKALADGKYTYRVKTRLGEGFDWQNTDFLFTVDTTAPAVTIDSRTPTSVTFTVNEHGSGLLEAPGAYDPANGELPVQLVSRNADLSVTTWTATFPEGTPFVSVRALDRGLNEGEKREVFDTAFIYAMVGNTIVGESNAVVVPASATGNLALAGFVSSGVTRLTVNGTEVELKDGAFSYVDRSYQGGNTTLELVIYGADGTEVGRRTIAVTQDSQPPVLTVDEGASVVNGEVQVDPATNTAHLTGEARDERADAALRLTIDQKPVEVNDQNRFDHTFQVSATQTSVSITLSDGVNLVTQVLPIQGRAPAGAGGFREPVFSNLQCTMPVGSCYVDSTSTAVKDGGNTLHLEGQILDPVGSIEFTPGSRATDSGTISTAAPIKATIESGKFTADLPMTTGINHFRMVIKSADGSVLVDRSYQIYFDIKPPAIDISEPGLIGGTLYTNADEVMFKGTISDDGWGHFLSINNAWVTDFIRLNNPGADVNLTEFEEIVAVKDGDQIKIYSRDAMGNQLIGVIPVVVDTVAPTVSLEEVSEGDTIRDRRTLEAAAEDDHLASLSVSINGEVVDTKTTTLSSEAVTVKDVLRDPITGEKVEATADAGAITDRARESERTSAAASDAGGAEPAADAAPAADADDPAVIVGGTQTENTETRLASSIDTSTLAAGQYTVAVESTDLAGNVTREATTFFVDAPAVINGPDAVEISVEYGGLGNQQAVAQKVLEQYSVTDDGSLNVDGDTVLSLDPGTVLVPGVQVVTLVATSPDGSMVSRQITVTITEEAPTDPGTDPGTPGGTPTQPGGALPPKVPGQPGATTDGPTTLKSGTGTSKKSSSKGSSKVRGYLPRTGAELGAVVLVAAATIAGGALMAGAAARRRRE